MPVSPAPVETLPPAPADAKLGPIVFAAGISDDRRPINPGTVFDNKNQRVYAVFPFSGMQAELIWTQVWYFNDIEFLRTQSPWPYGQAAESYVFVKLVGAGSYRLDLLVNNDLEASGQFAVQGPAAIGGPEQP